MPAQQVVMANAKTKNLLSAKKQKQQLSWQQNCL